MRPSRGRSPAAHARTAPPIAQTLALRPQIAQLAAQLQGAKRILAVGLGADLVTARELALKIEEGARIAATALQLESLLHGHLAGCDADTTGLVLLRRRPEARALARRPPCGWPRARPRTIGIPTVAIGGDAALAGLPAGVERLALPTGGTVTGALLTGAVALQLLTLELAHLVGSNPDLIRREQRAYREAAAVAETRADW